MSTERHDPILDACLDEVLGGRKPPDLTARILRALAEHQAAAASGESAPSRLPALVPPDVAIEHPTAPSTNGQFVSPRRDASPRKVAGWTRWNWLVVAASVGGLGIALGIAALQFLPPGAGNQPVARQPSRAAERPQQGEFQASPRAVAENPGVDRGKASPSVARTDDQGPRVIPLDDPGRGTDDAPPAAETRQPQYAQQPIPDEELLSFVNADIQRSWTEASVNPASPARDDEWCRRVFLRLLGRIPSNEEVTSYVDDKSPDKKQRLVDRLLGEEYAEQFAQHWAGVWTNVLIGRTGGTEGSLASREGLQAYLEKSLRENKPYSDIVAELLTATGANRSGAPDFNGAVNFLLAGMTDNATLATTRVSRVFLGQQLHCAQCHSHPSQDWSQHQYWALNSFLRQTEAKRDGDFVRLAAADFVNKPGVTKNGEVYYQQSTTGVLKAAEPEFIDGTKLPGGGKLAEVDRRKELASLVVNSREMPRALVNRLWSHFFGYGFTSPIDDMGPHNAPSHPEALDALAGQFVAHGYDLKHAIRWIVLSDAFGRSSQIPGGGLADMPDSGKTPLFSRYYSRPMKAEEVYNSLLAASDLRQRSGTGAELEQARRDFLFQLYRKMGTDDGEEESHEGGNVQSELMMNSSLTRRIVSREEEGRLRTLIGKESLPLNEKVEHLFLAALSRKPTAKELDAISKIMASAKDNQAAALEDIWWALLNSNEFILDH